MKTFLRLLLLTVILNLVRSFIGGVIEQATVLPRLMGAMAASRSYFNTRFTQADWVTSYAYNFVMWLVAVIAFHLMRPRLGTGRFAPSLKGFGLMYVFFAAVSAIYMNHYSHPRAFYVYNILDGLLVFGVVAVANALLYPRVVERGARRDVAESPHR
jgi:hypothetical protein